MSQGNSGCLPKDLLTVIEKPKGSIHKQDSCADPDGFLQE